MAFNTKEEAKELLRLLSKAEKAAEGEGAAELLLCVKSFPVSAEAIVSSKAWNLLKPLKNHKNPEIRSLVSDISTIWSKTVNASNPPETKNQFKKLVTATPSSESIQESTQLETNDPKRDLIRKQLQDSFSKVLMEMGTQLHGDESLDPARVAVEVEGVLFEKWGKAGAGNSNNAKYRSLLFNVRDPKNVDFRRRLLVGEIKAAEVPGMKTEDMRSDRRRDEVKVMTERWHGTAAEKDC